MAARCAKLFHELLSNEKAAHNMREHIQQQRDLGKLRVYKVIESV